MKIIFAGVEKPRIMHSRSLSRCCQAPQQLVRSRAGNFVSQDCIQCLKRARRIVQDEIPPATCSACGALVYIAMLGKNYAYRCQCGYMFELGVILPAWDDAGFKYSGLAAPGD
jgi:hypothetical protein